MRCVFRFRGLGEDQLKGCNKRNWQKAMLEVSVCSISVKLIFRHLTERCFFVYCNDGFLTGLKRVWNGIWEFFYICLFWTEDLAIGNVLRINQKEEGYESDSFNKERVFGEGGKL